MGRDLPVYLAIAVSTEKHWSNVLLTDDYHIYIYIYSQCIYTCI